MPTLEQRLSPRIRPDRAPIMFQRWSRLLFLHWTVPAELIQLPKGLHLDTFNSQAYIGIVPFFMKRIRPRFLFPLPKLSWFLELNLRTYVYDDEGQPGVWFFSLDCNQPIAVELARKLFHLPYQHARMTATVTDGNTDYYSSRHSQSKVSPPPNPAHYAYTPHNLAQIAEHGTLEFFLLERYLLFSASPSGKLFSGQVHHKPYLYQQAQVAELSTLPFAWNGFPEPSAHPVSSLYCAEVDVEIYPLRELPFNDAGLKNISNIPPQHS